MRSWPVWTLAVLFLCSHAAESQALLEDPRVVSALRLLEVWVEAQADYEDLPGVSMGVVHDQDLLWSGGFGYADLETREPATPTTIYSICSISKLFTSIAVMQLRDQEKLDLDEPIASYLPWFRIEKSHPDSPAVTLRGILTHSAGLPRESDHPYWTGPDYPFPEREEIVDRISRQATLYPSDRYFQYSNLGLTLAGEVVAAVSGRPYADYVEENILEPLGLIDTSPEIPDEHRNGRLATGYTRRMRDGARRVIGDYSVRGIAPAAGYASTVKDLAAFASWQFRLRETGGKEILRANTLREMQRVHWVDPDWETTWGLGFAIWRHGEMTFVGHGGSCPGYRTQLAMSTKDRIAIVFMTNGQGTDTRSYTSRAFEIVSPAITEAVEEPGQRPTHDLELEKYVGRYDWRDWGEIQIVIKEADLAVLPVPTDDPVGSLISLKRVDEHVFRRVREDDEDVLGEEWVFEVDAEGNVVRVKRHSNYADRIR